MPDQRLEKLKSILQLVDESISKKDFEANFKILIDFVKKLKENSALELESIKVMLKSATAKMESDQTSEMDKMDKEMMKKCEAGMNKMLMEHEAMMSAMDKKMTEVKDGTSPDAHIVALEASKMAQDALKPDLLTIGQVDENTSKKGDLIVNTISGLLEIEDIKDLRKELEELRAMKNKGTFTGAVGLSMMAADIRYAPIGTTGGVTILVATGAVDDSNLIFTFISEPKLVVVNGVTYRDGHGCSIATTTVTLDNPVGVGGDIYGI